MKSRLIRKIQKRTANSTGVNAKGVTVYIRELSSYERSKGRGRFRRVLCRLESTAWDDTIMEMSGCAGEFANDFRQKDVRDGCPSCTGMIMDNASEPDVMRRWGYR